MNQNIFLFPAPEAPSWWERQPAGFALRLEGSLAAELTLAPIIRLFPDDDASGRPARRGARRKGTS